MAKEKSISELKVEIASIQTRSNAIVERSRKESRAFSDDEQGELNENERRLVEIRSELALMEAGELGALRERMRHMETEAAAGGRRPVRGMSLRKAIFDLRTGKFSEETEKVAERGREIARAAGLPGSSEGIWIPLSGEQRNTFTATGDPGYGSDLITTDFLPILPELQDRLVLSQAGATMLTGLHGDIDLTSYGGTTVKWKGETETADDAGGKFAHKTLSPKRLTGVMYTSDMLLEQDTLGVEDYLRQQLIRAISAKLEATILGGAAHSATIPDGLFTGFAGAAKALDWGSIVDMETQADLDNVLVGQQRYIMHTKLYGESKKILMTQPGTMPTVASRFILEDGQLNGYEALRTNAVASVAATDKDPAKFGMVFGNWADLYVGQWGAIQLVRDGLTRAADGVVRLIVNSFWDATLCRDNSLVRAWFTLATETALKGEKAVSK